MKKEFVPVFTAIKAKEMANTVNRNHCIEMNFYEISKWIKDAASLGLRETTIPFTIIVHGAENVYELGEIASIIDKSLRNGGYTTKICPNGHYYVAW